MAEDSIDDHVREYNYPIPNSKAVEYINKEKKGDFEKFIDFVFGKPNDKRKMISYASGTVAFLGNLIYNLNEKAMQIVYGSRDGLTGYIDKIGVVIKNPKMIVPALGYSISLGIISGLVVYGGIKGIEAGIRAGKRLNKKIKDNLAEKAVNYFNKHKLVVTR